jgi:hypothetical protein
LATGIIVRKLHKANSAAGLRTLLHNSYYSEENTIRRWSEQHIERDVKATTGSHIETTGIETKRRSVVIHYCLDKWMTHREA